MAKRVLRWLGILSVLWGGLVPGSNLYAEESNFRHAYYLFRTGSFEGCADCYIPLLLTVAPLPGITTKQASGAPQELEVSVIVTYERDSVWEIPANPRIVKMAEIDSSSRILRMNDVKYRYQETPLQEAIRLLKNPLGAIPISRPMLPDRPTDEKIQSLLKRLSVQ